MNKTLTLLGLVGILAFTTATSCDVKPTEYYPADMPDCDADDRSPKWDVKDCGPSPRPMKTASQPKPTPKPRKTR